MHPNKSHSKAEEKSEWTCCPTKSAPCPGWKEIHSNSWENIDNETGYTFSSYFSHLNALHSRGREIIGRERGERERERERERRECRRAYNVGSYKELSLFHLLPLVKNSVHLTLQLQPQRLSEPVMSFRSATLALLLFLLRRRRGRNVTYG